MTHRLSIASLAARSAAFVHALVSRTPPVSPPPTFAGFRQPGAGR